MVHLMLCWLQVLWLKSRSSEVWLDRRTNYTRSLAVMSMVSCIYNHILRFLQCVVVLSHKYAIEYILKHKYIENEYLFFRLKLCLVLCISFVHASCHLLWSKWQVGYLLGLGDRHPSNLMLDRHRYISPVLCLSLHN